MNKVGKNKKKESSQGRKASDVVDFYLGNLPRRMRDMHDDLLDFMKKKKIPVVAINSKDKHKFCFMTVAGAYRDAMIALNGTIFECKALRIRLANSPQQVALKVNFYDVNSDITEQDLESFTGGSNGIIHRAERRAFVTVPSAADVKTLVKNGSITIKVCTMPTEAAMVKDIFTNNEHRVVFFQLDPKVVTVPELESETGGNEGYIIRGTGIGSVCLPSATHAEKLVKKCFIIINRCKMRVKHFIPFQDMKDNAVKRKADSEKSVTPAKKKR